MVFIRKGGDFQGYVSFREGISNLIQKMDKSNVPRSVDAVESPIRPAPSGRKNVGTPFPLGGGFCWGEKFLKVHLELFLDSILKVGTQK